MTERQTDGQADKAILKGFIFNKTLNISHIYLIFLHQRLKMERSFTVSTNIAATSVATTHPDAAKSFIGHLSNYGREPLLRMIFHMNNR